MSSFTGTLPTTLSEDTLQLWSTASMRLVLLTAHSPEGDVQHRYVAKKIAEAFPSDLKAIIVATGVSRSTRERIKRWRQRYTFSEVVSRAVVYAAHLITGEKARKGEKIARELFPAGEDGRMPRRDLLKHVTSHNARACAELLHEIKPDIVVVYGTLIIGRKLISTLPLAINLHTGLSPRYRGSDTNFWPIFNEEPQYLGATVHRLDPGIDSGPILARGRPCVTADDDEHTLFAKAVRIGADLLCDAVLRDSQGRTKPHSQALSEGREYRSVERTLRAELRVRKLLKGGILKEGLSEWREDY